MIEQAEIFKPLIAQADIAEKGWQGWIKNAGDNYSNQYELPLLFFAVCFVLYLTNSVTPLVMGLAWFFFASRIVHSLVHLSKNIIGIRFLVFLAGAIALATLVVIAIRAVF